MYNDGNAAMIWRVDVRAGFENFQKQNLLYPRRETLPHAVGPVPAGSSPYSNRHRFMHLSLYQGHVELRRRLVVTTWSKA